MMTFLLFAPAITKWLGWRKDRKSWRDRLGRFWHLLCSHTSILFCVTCYQWHSVEQLFWKLWTKRHSLRADSKHLESLLAARVYKSLIGNLARHSFSLFDRNKTQPQTSKMSEQRLAYHWQNDGRLQKFANNHILCWLIPSSQMSFCYKVFKK